MAGRRIKIAAIQVNNRINGAFLLPLNFLHFFHQPAEQPDFELLRHPDSFVV